MLEGTTQNLLLDFVAPPGTHDFNFPDGQEMGRKINQTEGAAVAGGGAGVTG